MQIQAAAMRFAMLIAAGLISAGPPWHVEN
jgi:hypothetical protein